MPAETAPAVEPDQPSASASADLGAESATSHVLVKGDTYWDLAVSYYGKGTMWKKIGDANPDYEPRRLPIGAAVTIPAR